MTDLPTTIPELPDMEQLREQARGRMAHFEAVKAAAEQEIGRCREFLGQPAITPPSLLLAVSDESYRRALEAVAQARGFSGIATVAGRAHMSRTQAGRACALAVDRGHATRERHGRKLKYRIAQAGEEYLTEPTS